MFKNQLLKLFWFLQPLNGLLLNINEEVILKRKKLDCKRIEKAILTEIRIVWCPICIESCIQREYLLLERRRHFYPSIFVNTINCTPYL